MYLTTADASAGGEPQGGAMEASGRSGRHQEMEDGLYPPEPDRASLHDSEGLLSRNSWAKTFNPGLKLIIVGGTHP